MHPRLLPNAPAFGQDVAWGESNAVALVNSWIDARSERYADFVDLRAAVAGRAPRVGLHVPANRRAGLRFRLGDDVPEALRRHESLFPILGYAIGSSWTPTPVRRRSWSPGDPAPRGGASTRRPPPSRWRRPVITPSRTLSCLDYHTAGEPFRIVVGGVGQVPGRTMLEKTVYARDHLSTLRRQILLEPRGHGAMCGAVVTEPTVRGADAGVVFLEPLGPVYMCGHGTIALATWLVETGQVATSDGEAGVTLDTAAGLVRARVRLGAPGGPEARRVVEVAFENVPAFSYQLGLTVEAEGLPPVAVDLAYGGHFYAIVEAARLGLPLTPEAAPRLVEAGERIRAAIEASVPLEHPERPGVPELLYVQWTGPARHPGAHRRNVVVVAPRAVDRSPCGTGTSARMADLYAKGELGLDEPFVHESIVDTRFRGRLVGTVRLGAVEAVVPEVAGRAHLVAVSTLVVDPDDPLRDGFLI